jgi:hypothetical protein
MPPDARKGAWRFYMLWKLPTHMVGSTSFTDTNQSNVMDELETAFKLDVVEQVCVRHQETRNRCVFATESRIPLFGMDVLNRI